MLSLSSKWKGERRKQYFRWQCLLLANFFCIFWESQSKILVDLWKIHTWLHIFKGIKTSFDHKILRVLDAELCTLSSYFYSEWSFDNNHHQFIQNHFLNLWCIYLICNLKIASNLNIFQNSFHNYLMNIIPLKIFSVLKLFYFKFFNLKVHHYHFLIQLTLYWCRRWSF